MATRSFIGILSGLLVAVLLLTLAVPAVNTAAADDSGKSSGIDPDAAYYLKRMSEYLAAAGEFSFEAEVTSDEVIAGQRIQMTDIVEAVVRRPNKLWIDTHGDLFSKRFWYNGSSVSILSFKEQFYATTKAPSTIDAMLDDMMDKYGITTPVVDFLFSSPYDILMENVTGAIYAGFHLVDGVLCHHLAFTQEDIDWQIWIDDGKQIVPRKFVVTYKNEPDSPQSVTLLKDWDFASKYPDNLFEFQAPDKSRKIEFLPPKKQ